MSRTSRRAALTGDRGSILLSMLGMLIVSALLLVVAGTVVNGQQQTRFDRSFEQALQVAEVGHDQMISLLQSNTAASPDQIKGFLGMSTPYNAAELPTLEGTTTDGGVYRTTVEQLPVDPSLTSVMLRGGSLWKVTSEGWTDSGPTRTIESELRVRPLFSLGAFGKTTLDFNGGNGAASYDSKISKDICQLGSAVHRADVGIPTNALSNTGDVEPCDRTGITAVATNGVLRLDGNARTNVQRAEVHNAQSPFVPDPLNDATGKCEAQTCSLSTESPKRLFFYREPIELPPIKRCQSQAAGSEGAFNGVGTLGSREYYFSDVTLDGRTVFTGTPPTSTNDATMTVLCVSGRLNITGDQLVNFEPYTYGSSTYYRPRQPGGLLIFVTGASNPEIKIGGGSSISAAIFAPNAAVTGGAQANVYGSLIANSIVNQGGWNFFFDQDLAGLKANAGVSVRDWRERY